MAVICNVTHNIGIQMKPTELTKTYMMISNWQNPFGCDDLR